MRWEQLQEHAHDLGVEVIVHRLPEPAGPGLYWPFEGRDYILIDDRLEEPHRTAVMCHELVHARRGGGVARAGMPPTWRPVVLREERRVDRLVAQELIPTAELARFCDRLADLGEGVSPWIVADEFDTTERVARDALEQLTRHERGDR